MSNRTKSYEGRGGHGTVNVPKADTSERGKWRNKANQQQLNDVTHCRTRVVVGIQYPVGEGGWKQSGWNVG